MANNKSAIKRVKVSEGKKNRNRIVKSSVRTAIKKFEQAVTNGQLEEAKELYSAASSKLDKAVAKGILHKNMANRNKANLALHLQKAQAAQ